MSKAVKIAVVSTIVVGIGVATFFIIRNIRKKLGVKKGQSLKELKEAEEQKAKEEEVKANTPSKPKEPEYNPTADAKELHRTMAGAGTYDDAFWRLSNRLTSAQKSMVKGKFNATYGNLKDWIEGDFSWSAEDRALKSWGY